MHRAVDQVKDFAPPQSGVEVGARCRVDERAGRLVQELVKIGVRVLLREAKLEGDRRRPRRLWRWRRHGPGS